MNVNTQSNINTLSVLYTAVQQTLTKAVGAADLKTFTPSPEEATAFDEATNAIIFEKIIQKLSKKDI